MHHINRKAPDEIEEGKQGEDGEIPDRRHPDQNKNKKQKTKTKRKNEFHALWKMKKEQRKVMLTVLRELWAALACSTVSATVLKGNSVFAEYTVHMAILLLSSRRDTLTWVETEGAAAFFIVLGEALNISLGGGYPSSRQEQCLVKPPALL